MDDSLRHPTLHNAHLNAKVLLNEEWYYSPVDDLAPFGSDDAADTYQSFYLWRQQNRDGSPSAFIKEHFQYWGYPMFNIYSLDYEEILQYLKSNSQIGDRLLFGIDASLIATAIGQLHLEGIIDSEMKKLATIAIKRQLMPQILTTWDSLQDMRKTRLLEFQNIIDKAQ